MLKPKSIQNFILGHTLVGTRYLDAENLLGYEFILDMEKEDWKMRYKLVPKSTSDMKLVLISIIKRHNS